MPATTALLISEETRDAGAWVVTYRSQVSSTERDMEALEMNSPQWMLEYLFTSRTRVKDPVKLTFILEPAPNSGLKEMPEGTTRLSASRVLRARKIMAFIFDKLNLAPAVQRARQESIGGGGAGSPPGVGLKGLPAGSPPLRNTRADSLGLTPGIDEHTPEQVIELLCGTEVVDPRITLATLKQYYGTGGDMLLHYRLREGVQL